MDALVDGFVARNATGLQEAYSRWSRELFSVAYHVVRDPTVAEDCVHDALLRVWRAPNTFTGDRRLLRAYLLMCVRNESLSMLRSERRRAARELKAQRLADPATESFESVDPVETERLEAALSHLPEEQLSALQSAYYGNKTHVQIAAESGLPLGTIKSRIAMAMRKLQSELGALERNAR